LWNCTGPTPGSRQTDVICVDAQPEIRAAATAMAAAETRSRETGERVRIVDSS
jgi:hypothetical protein